MLVQSGLYIDAIITFLMLFFVGWVFFVVLAIVFDRRRKKRIRSSSAESGSIEPLTQILETLRIERGAAPVPPGPDFSSSPVGGTCLNCGSTVTEETSLECPDCGVKRERCVICQRFVVGGQELLACPFCHSLSHSNEIITWVQKKNKCPYCGRKLKQHQLLLPDIIHESPTRVKLRDDDS